MMRVLSIAGLLFTTALALAGPAQSAEILDVLQRSQQLKLTHLNPAADTARADIVQRSFDAVTAAATAGGHERPLTLRVVDGPVLAETLLGQVVVANVSLADLPEGARLFILAHEVGHVQAEHWHQMGDVYMRWIPGAVTPDATQAVRMLLRRDASAVAHQQEFEADAFALRLLRSMGRPTGEAFSAFAHVSWQADTATHPAARRRMAQLRADAQRVMLRPPQPGSYADRSGNDPE